MTRRSGVPFVLLLGVRLLVAACSPAYAGAQTLAGLVVDKTTGVSVPLATVTILDQDSVPVAAALSDLSGYFSIEAPAEGEYWASAEAAFYQTYTGGPVLLSEGDTASVAFTLVPGAVELEGLVVEARSRARRMIRGGYFDRRESGQGWHLDRKALANRQRFRISETLRAIPVLSMVSTRYGSREPVFRGWRAAAPAGAGMCYPRIFIDGMLFSPGGEMPSEIDRALDPEDVEAVEAFQPGTVPAQFGGAGLSPCGVIVIWRK